MTEETKYYTCMECGYNSGIAEEFRMVVSGVIAIVVCNMCLDERWT